MSIALFEDGKVMRIINDDALNNRCEEVGFQNAASRGKIEKLVQGYMHVFALDEHGSLFVIGLNHEGQLGLGKRDQYRADEFEQVSVINEKIVDVAASCFSCLSTALTESGKVYIWGNNRGVCIFEPRLTPFSSLHEAFFVCSEPWVTCRPINVGELPAITSKPENLLVGSFEKAFRDPIGTSE
ncbi:uncharacterized protein LOC135837642 [Planococcus citri]|uniref:uncharacterized protein LOC135837642 n=1 Tax=Planococcus citri TaxID=170843 RepID=UPI0031FA226D